MKKLLFIFFSFTFLNANDIQKAFLVAVYDDNKNVNVITKINSSNGKLINTETLYNNLTKKIYGYELTFKHLDVQKGYFEVFIDGKLYDTKVFVK